VSAFQILLNKTAPPLPPPAPWLFLLVYAHFSRFRATFFQLAVGCKRGAFVVISLGKRWSSFWKVFCTNKYKKRPKKMENLGTD